MIYTQELISAVKDPKEPVIGVAYRVPSLYSFMLLGCNDGSGWRPRDRLLQPGRPGAGEMLAASAFGNYDARFGGVDLARRRGRLLLHEIVLKADGRPSMTARRNASKMLRREPVPDDQPCNGMRWATKAEAREFYAWASLAVPDLARAGDKRRSLSLAPYVLVTLDTPAERAKYDATEGFVRMRRRRLFHPVDGPTYH